ncbi:KOW domain-containing RNA-binding protein [Paenibacillus timonensis]|jgi:large subunit ribosomal protein L14e|uniref:KOW domain-containing protein n=1 Tax=Paenibacillus timonensis TaxID=225915 RepID=A0ABW3SDL2_9BACL|nr:MULTISPECIES: KOW domain-containing RNA-binding protein [Paenibacillus]MCH1641094.1 KOW domain-containing RNA-binding protein [Paenibacillus timonensis]MDU2240034.1 KOW domain-containing RNA-binding protein [Paenibacillus sp.]
MNVKERSEPQVGQLVKVLKGRDAGAIYVIVGILDDRFVWIADGNKRKFDGPKRKNAQHLELLPIVSSEVVHSLQESGRVTNGKLRHAVLVYQNSADSMAEEKGD